MLMLAPTPFFGDHGRHVRILEQVRALRRHDVEVLVVTYHVGRDVAAVRTVRTARLPWVRRLPVGFSIHKPALDLLLLVAAARAARRFRPDVIHGHLHEGAALAVVLGASSVDRPWPTSRGASPGSWSITTRSPPGDPWRRSRGPSSVRACAVRSGSSRRPRLRGRARHARGRRRTRDRAAGRRGPRGLSPGAPDRRLAPGAPPRGPAGRGVSGHPDVASAGSITSSRPGLRLPPRCLTPTCC